MAVALVVLMAVGCKQNKPEPKETGFELALTNADSAAVVQLVDQFFGYSEHGGYTDAAAMIHKAYNNPDSVYLEPEPLDNQQLNRMIGMLKSLKINLCLHIIRQDRPQSPRKLQKLYLGLMRYRRKHGRIYYPSYWTSCGCSL